MTIAVLGYGHFGSAFVELLGQTGLSARVFDPHADVPTTVRAASAADAVAGAEWVVLAVPVERLESVIQDLQPRLRPRQTVMDVASVKEKPGMWLDRMLGTEIPHVGSHPLFGPVSLARGDRPRRVIVCASDQHPNAAERASALWESLGCEVALRDPTTHDRVMARTHALAFFVARAMVEMGIGEELALAPPSFRGMANMLAAVRADAEHLFAAIERENPYAAEARRELLQHLKRIDASLCPKRDANSL